MNTALQQHDNVSTRRKFSLLAPDGESVPREFTCVQDDKSHHGTLLRQIQRLRGQIYLQDGAISDSQLDSEGCHVMPDDRKSWHLLRLRSDGSISGCARVLVHPRGVSYPQLRLSSSALARSGTWGAPVREAIELELARAEQSGCTVVEPGGWALAEDLRGSTEALSIAVAAFAWSQILGGCVGFLTATVRHGSASILRRIGGASIHWKGASAPAYFDPAYGCDMELLRFDSQALNPRFETILTNTRNVLLEAPVVTTAPSVFRTNSMAA